MSLLKLPNPLILLLSYILLSNLTSVNIRYASFCHSTCTVPSSSHSASLLSICITMLVQSNLILVILLLIRVIGPFLSTRHLHHRPFTPGLKLTYFTSFQPQTQDSESYLLCQSDVVWIPVGFLSYVTHFPIVQCHLSPDIVSCI